MVFIINNKNLPEGGVDEPTLELHFMGETKPITIPFKSYNSELKYLYDAESLVEQVLVVHSRYKIDATEAQFNQVL